MLTRRPHRRALVAGAVALATLAAGCTAGAGPSSPTPIRIGSLTPVTGVGLLLPQQLAALKAAARDVNAHGGIGRRPVQIDNCDDHNDPNVAQACAHRLVADGVIATAADADQFAMIETPILDQAGIPEVSPAGLSQEEMTLPTSFPMAPGLPGYVAGEVAGMKRRGLHRLFVVVLDTPATQVSVQLAALAARAADVSIVGTAAVPPPATNVTPWVQQAMRSTAQVVMVLLPAPLTFAFAAASRQAHAGYLLAMVEGILLPGDIRRLGGANAITENDVEFAVLPPLSAADRFPAITTFQSDMDAEVALGDQAAAHDLRSAGALGAWLAVQVIGRLASTLPRADAAGVLAALRSGRTVDTLGLTPPWVPARTGPMLLPRVTNRFGYYATQRNGVEQLEDPTPFDALAALGGL